MRRAGRRASSRGRPDGWRASRDTRAPPLAHGRERLLQPRDDRFGDRRRDVLVLERAVLVGFARGRRREEMVDAGDLDDLDGAVLALLRERLEEVGVPGLDLSVELALDDQDG